MREALKSREAQNLQRERDGARAKALAQCVLKSIEDTTASKKLMQVVKHYSTHEQAFNDLKLVSGLASAEDIIARFNGREEFVDEFSKRNAALRRRLVQYEYE